MRLSSRPDRVTAVLLAIVGLAVLLRLPTLGMQSFWADEAATADVVDRPFGDLLDAVREQESTPPLFYALVWPLARVLGDSELVLRLLPALFGIATVPVIFALARRLWDERAGLAAALLVATSPVLIWFSQEARAYALLVLLAAASLFALVRLVDGPTPRRAVVWGVLAGAALATHYFAIFVVAGEAAWLIAARVLPRRAVPATAEGTGAPRPGVGVLAAAFTPLVASGLALLPLALDQREADRAGFIAQEPFDQRVAQVPKQWLVGYDAPAEGLLAVVAGALCVVLAAGLVRLLARPGPSRPALLATVALVAASLLVPVVLAALGDDYVVSRNLIASLVPLLVLLGIGATALPRRVAVPAVGALAVLGSAIAIVVPLSHDLGREDWRAAVEALPPPPEGGRLIAVVPGSGTAAVEYYVERMGADPDRPVIAPESVAVVATASRGRAGDEREPSYVPQPGVPFLTGGDAPTIIRGDGWATAVARVFDGFYVRPSQLVAITPGASVVAQRPAR